MLNKRSIIFIIVFTNLIYNSFSQTSSDNFDSKDLQTWTSFELSYKLSKKWSFTLEEELRLKDDSKITDQYFTELGVEYGGFKKIEFGIGARYIKEHDTKGKIQGYETHFRFHFNTSYKYKLNNFSFQHRLRYQNKNELGVDDKHIINARFKTAITYNIKGWKLDPKVSGEIFNRFKKGEDNKFSKYRLSLETKYKVNKIGSISLFYKVEKEINKPNPETIDILGLKFSYNFK